MTPAEVCTEFWEIFKVKKKKNTRRRREWEQQLTSSCFAIGTAESGSEEWTGGHVFTSRCLPCHGAVVWVCWCHWLLWLFWFSSSSSCLFSTCICHWASHEEQQVYISLPRDSLTPPTGPPSSSWSLILFITQPGVTAAPVSHLPDRFHRITEDYWAAHFSSAVTPVTSWLVRNLNS